MRIRIAAGVALAFVASLFAVSPAEAAVTAFVNGSGDVIINGDSSPNHVQVILCGGYAQIIVDYGEPMEPLPVADDMVINLRGGSDGLQIRTGVFRSDEEVAPESVQPNDAHIPPECLDIDIPDEVGITEDHEHVADIPGNLRIMAASGGDSVNLWGRGPGGLSIGKDLILNLSSGSNNAHLNYVYVGDDVSIRASGGSDFVNLYNYWIHDRLDINLGGGTNETYLGSGEPNGGEPVPASGAGRTTIRGSGGFDRVNTGGGGPIDLGHNPQITTGGNEDRIRMDLVGWTGRFRMNTGSGDDNVFMSDCCGTRSNDLANVEHEHGGELERGRLDVNTGSGDDHVFLQQETIGSDRFNGGPGTQDCIFTEEEDPPATILNFEFENEQTCPDFQL